MARAGKDLGAVRVDDLARFQRDLRQADKVVAKELRAEIRDVAQDVAREANVVRGSTTSWQYRGTTRGTRGVVRSVGPKGYVARFIEFGFHPGGGRTFVEGRNFVGRALERQEDRIVDEIGDAVERAAAKVGWR